MTMTTISYYTGSEFIEETLTANEVAALKVIPEYAIIFGESDTETVETETAEIETTTGSDIETAEIENVTGAETETVETAVEVEVAGGVYVNANATELDKYIAIYRQGDIIMKRGAALKMVALALINRNEIYRSKGYNSIVEFAAKEFKLAAQTTRQYIQTANKFYDIPAIAEKFNAADLVDEKGNIKKVKHVRVASIFADTETGEDFSANSLTVMRALDIDTVKELMDKGVIDTDMTVEGIKQAIKPYRKRANSKAAETETGSDIETSSDTETSVHTLTENDIETSTGSDNDIIAALKAEIARLTAKNEELQAENDNLRETVAQYSNANATLHARAAGYSSTNKALHTEIDNLKAENDALTNENQQLIDNAAAQAETIDTLQAENKRLQNSNNSYKSANSKAKNTITNLVTENDTLKAEIETLKATGSDNVETDNGANAENVTIVG